MSKEFNQRYRGPEEWRYIIIEIELKITPEGAKLCPKDWSVLEVGTVGTTMTIAIVAQKMSQDIIMEDLGELDPQDEMQVEMDLIPTITQSMSLFRSSKKWYLFVASEEQEFQILYIPDSSKEPRKVEADVNLGWTKHDIMFAHYQTITIKHLTGFVYKIGKNKTDNIPDWPADMTFQLWIFIIVDELKGETVFNAKSMKWKEFHNMVLDPPSGIDYLIDYCDSKNCCGLNNGVFNTYKTHIILLARQTQFWQLIKLTMGVENRWTTIIGLQMIVKKIGGYTLVTMLLREDHEIPSDMVLK
ncbi:hypothetical protein HD554DRAFT_2038930 [Boletus coccyginus]|nr:hypothetical protein HD554DRAFT_2038930 [Boletus coccyginus]